MIIEELKNIIKDGLASAIKTGNLNIDPNAYIHLERPRDKNHGNWATNVALVTAKQAKKAPREIAGAIVQNLPKNPYISKTEIAGPGFINFFLTKEWFYHVLKQVEAADEKYGQIDFGKKKKVNVEFVSANPVGPLHIGHGRWAAVGDSLARLLKSAGYQVTKEFYINDFGRQTDLYVQSLVARAKDLPLPEDGYKGDYVIDAVSSLKEKYGPTIFDIEEKLKELAINEQLIEIKSILEQFNVEFDVWTSEKESLHKSGKVREIIGTLKKKDIAYDKEDATWLKTSDYGDEKDRVILRSNGETTYFAADIAYHKDKFDRGFDEIIDIWGADHHGYIARVKAAIAAVGYDPNKFKVILGQLVRLFRGDEIVKISKRTGKLITFKELLDEVGKDAVRYIFLTKSTDTTLDFDIDLAKEQSDKNPVYYVQYAHARICSILRVAGERQVIYQGINKANLALLTEEPEIDLISQVEQFEEVIEDAAKNLTPYILTTYASKLSSSFHYFYNKCRVITEDIELTQARLALLNCTHITLRNVLSLLGVSAPERM